MKGIILAGGAGTRLHPLTTVMTKQLLPVYDKPMIYYPMSTLILGGIRDILIISDPVNIGKFMYLFADGSKFGLNIDYAEQAEPNGIAEAFIIGENFIGDDPVTLILGDNIFHTPLISDVLKNYKEELDLDDAVIFAYPVNDPRRYGVVTLDNNNRASYIVEKPQEPKSNLAVVGLYMYNNNVIDIAKKLEPSNRGELEITDINQHYLSRNMLRVKQLGRGSAWLDAGTPDSLLQASNYIHTIQERQGFIIGCIEEAAWRMGFINDQQIDKLSESYYSDYGFYLRKILEDKLYK